jgi:hypothetical protein
MVAVLASEIVAGALQDLDRAVVVGSRSLEKDWCNDRLMHRTQLKFTISRYYTPSGRCIQALVTLKDKMAKTIENHFNAFKQKKEKRGLTLKRKQTLCHLLLITDTLSKTIFYYCLTNYITKSVPSHIPTLQMPFYTILTILRRFTDTQARTVSILVCTEPKQRTSWVGFFHFLICLS